MTWLVVLIIVCTALETIVREIAKLLFAATGMILRLLFFKSRS